MNDAVRKPGMAFTALILLLVFFGNAFADHPQSTQRSDEPIVLVWVPFWDQQVAMQSYDENSEAISHVSLFWYYLTENGDIEKYRYADTDPAVVRQIQKNGDKALALVANLPDLDPGDPKGNWNDALVRKVLKKKKSRANHVRKLVALAVEGGFDGIDIDYESLRRKDRKLFTVFIQELSDALDKENKILALALHPKTAEFKSSEDNGSHAQDWVALSRFADQLHIMGYGEHYPGSHPGPIASNQWVQNILEYLGQLDVDKSKFVLGLPLYAEMWKVGTDNDVMGIHGDFNYQSIQNLKSKHFGIEEYLPDINSNRYEYKNNGEQHVTYFENAVSVNRNIEVGKRYGVYNFAFWRIGGEDASVWKVIN